MRKNGNGRLSRSLNRLRIAIRDGASSKIEKATEGVYAAADSCGVSRHKAAALIEAVITTAHRRSPQRRKGNHDTTRFRKAHRTDTAAPAMSTHPVMTPVRDIGQRTRSENASRPADARSESAEALEFATV